LKKTGLEFQKWKESLFPEKSVILEYRTVVSCYMTRCYVMILTALVQLIVLFVNVVLKDNLGMSCHFPRNRTKPSDYCRLLCYKNVSNSNISIPLFHTYALTLVDGNCLSSWQSSRLRLRLSSISSNNNNHLTAVCPGQPG